MSTTTTAREIDEIEEELNLPDLLPVGLIHVDASNNVSRGGVCYGPGHPDVRRQAKEIKQRDHVPPLGLRPLVKPIVRPCGSAACCSEEMMALDDAPAHRFELVYGYVRFVAATRILRRSVLRTKQPNVEVCVSSEISDEEALDRNVAENLVRSQPTDVEFARGMAEIKRRTGRDPFEIAKAVGARSVREVEDAICIVERCPKDVIDEWESRRSKDLRYVLVRISRIDPQERWQEKDRHERMREIWRAEVDAFDERPKGYTLPSPTKKGPADPRDAELRPPKTINRYQAERVLGAVALCHEVYDDRTESYRPISEGERAAVRAAFRFAADPRGTIPPVR